MDMSCAACATRVGKLVDTQPGVASADVNYASAAVAVEYDPSQTSPEKLREAVRNGGYDLVIVGTLPEGDSINFEHNSELRLFSENRSNATKHRVITFTYRHYIMLQSYTPCHLDCIFNRMIARILRLLLKFYFVP